jgi:chromosome segregation ATPase
VKLRAEANILSRSNERLKAEKTADAARLAALQQEIKALQQQLADAGAVADKLRAEIGERDGVIGDNYGTMQGLRRRVQELETHKFVLTYKVCVGMRCSWYFQ